MVMVRPKKNCFLVENHVKSRKTCLGVWGVWGGILIVHFKKRVAQKFRSFILLHLGPVTFRFYIGKTQKPLIVMVVGFMDASTTPETTYFKH